MTLEEMFAMCKGSPEQLDDSILEADTISSSEGNDSEQKEMDTCDQTGSDEEMNRRFLELLRLAHGSGNDESDDGEDDDDLEESGSDASMDADDYHNKSCDYARMNRYRAAAKLVEKGHMRYPRNVDLIADAINYRTKCGDTAKAKEHYRTLCELISRDHWNWRAFTFSFDFLILDAEKNEQECRSLIADYKRVLPFEEKAYMAESELEEALGNHQRSMDVLREAVDSLNAPQCALHLADKQKDRGMLEEVVKTGLYGISASSDVQPSINSPYLLMLWTMAQDALLWKGMYSGTAPTQEAVDMIIADYEDLGNFIELHRHHHEIEKRCTMLKILRRRCSPATPAQQA